MSSHVDRARELRHDPDRHYNCAQGVLVPFAAEAGLNEELAYKIGESFGGGMRSGRVCGALTGTLMAMGLLDLSSPESTQTVIREFTERHEGCTDCRDLLRLAAEHGIERHENCDGLVYEGVEMVEKLLAERA